MSLPRFRIGPWLPEGETPKEHGDYLTLWPDTGELSLLRYTGHVAWFIGTRFAPILRAEGAGDTVRVRIAVAVTADRKWSATGHHRQSDEESRLFAEEDLDDESRVSFVEADVPKPEAPRTVEGEVAQ